MATHSRSLAWRILMDRGTWWATVHGVAKSKTQLSTQVVWHIWQVAYVIPNDGQRTCASVTAPLNVETESSLSH